MVSILFIWFPVGVHYKTVLCEWVAEREGLCLPAPSCSTLQGAEVTGGRGKLFLPQKQQAMLTWGKPSRSQDRQKKETHRKEGGSQVSIRDRVKTEVFPRAARNSVEAIQTRKSPK